MNVIPATHGIDLVINPEDLEVALKNDPALVDEEDARRYHTGLWAVSMYRMSHELWIQGRKEEARDINFISHHITGSDIHPGATIGKRFFIDHATGVVIGETAEIGDNCTLYQGVTLGGTGKDVGKRHPTLGNNVMVGSGAKILGPFKIGDNSKVAANAVVLKEIPPNCTAVGIPAKVVKMGEKKVPQSDLDQIHIPDPVAQELKAMRDKINQLEKKLKKNRLKHPERNKTNESI